MHGVADARDDSNGDVTLLVLYEVCGLAAAYDAKAVISLLSSEKNTVVIVCVYAPIGEIRI